MRRARTRSCSAGVLLAAGRCAQRMAVRQKERHAGVLTELMTQQAKAARCVIESSGDVFAGDFIDVEGAQRLVLAVQGVDGAEEGVNEGIVGISQWRLFINVCPLSQYYDAFQLKCNKYMTIRHPIALAIKHLWSNEVELCLSINGHANR